MKTPRLTLFITSLTTSHHMQRQLYPIYTLPLWFINIRFNINLPSVCRYVYFGSPSQSFACISGISHRRPCQMPRTSPPYNNLCIQIKGKGQVCPKNRPWTPRREAEVEFYSFFNLGVRCNGWLTPRPCRFAPGKETRYPFCRRLGGPQGLSGRVRKTSPRPGRPAGSESLYRLSRPGPLFIQMSSAKCGVALRVAEKVCVGVVWGKGGTPEHQSCTDLHPRATSTHPAPSTYWSSAAVARWPCTCLDVSEAPRCSRSPLWQISTPTSCAAFFGSSQESISCQ